MFNSMMPSLNIGSLPFVVFMGGFPSRCQNLSSGAIRPGGLLFSDCFNILHRGAVLLEEYICRVNMAYMGKLGQLRVNITK